MPKTPTISFVSLGCSKNLVDSERMLGLLAQGRYAIVPESEPADLMIVNTCGFIETARQESIGVIEEMIDRKRLGQVKGVVVAGCLAEREKDSLLERFPEVDDVVGVFGREEIVRVADRLLGGLSEQRGLFRPAPVQAQDDRARLRITPRHLAYLKVSEGCDRFCTFCAIPFMRGKHVTKPIEMVVAEARELAADGVRELILVAQDMTYYGARPLRPAPAERFAQGARAGRGNRLAPHPLLLSPVLHGRALRRSGRLAKDHPLPRYAAPAHQRPPAEADEPPAHATRKAKRSSPGCERPFRAWSCAPRSSWVSRGKPRPNSTSSSNFVEATKFERLGVFPYSFEGDTPAAKLAGPSAGGRHARAS